MFKSIKTISQLYGVIASLVIVCCANCKPIYKAGNLVYLGYPIETSLKSSLVRKYIDTLTQHYGYGVPPKWEYNKKIIDLDSVNNKRIYFKGNPEEMYLLSFSGMLLLSDVFNPKIREGQYIAERELVSAEEEQRMKSRLEHEILDAIEKMAKRDGLPDSLIYK